MPRIYTAASLYLTAVLEYLASEVLELASNEAKDSKKKRIEPRHLQQAVRKDKDFKQLLSNVTIPDAGVLPKFHQNLLPKSSADRQKEASPAT
ncbi:hypothetical protein DH2020_001604 [Rehmannia glutinosa]|uniref:Histone H2A n=1 Tax=Rehmannia glutinosa TaxID=99300 RepID=A0ABR0XZU4_REHGL